jgi:integral membrane protein
LAGVRNLFPVYRILAFVVGVLLTLMVFVGMPMKYFLTEGTNAQVFGDHLTAIVAVAHGWIYIVYVIVAFFLARRQAWSAGFTLLMLAAGLIPIVIFWVEHQVATRVRAEEPLLL